MTTSAINPREAWEIYAKTTPAHLIDAIEENILELGYVEDSDEFFTQCLWALAAEVGR